MRVGLHPVHFDYDGGARATADTLARLGRAADQGGCDSILLMDHFLQLPGIGAATDPMLEGYTTAAFLAAHTERVKLGLLVTGVTYRHPGVLAKVVTTLDVLSGGRAVLGIGAAWFEREHLALGVPFPPLAERFERLEDTLRIVLQLWSDDDGPFEGTHHRLAETISSPQPLQQPHPPILIGGGGETKTLRFVARYGDACNLMARSHDEVAHKLRVLDGHCDDVGRDPAEIERTIMSVDDPFADLPATLADLEGYAELGVDTVIVVPTPGRDPVAFVERVGEELVPALADRP